MKGQALNPALLQGISCVVWDWNGTLLDDAPVCLDVMNSLLQRRGLPQITQAQYRETFCFPVIEWYKTLGFRLDLEDFQETAEEFVKAYGEAVACCTLHSGVRELLAAFRDTGIRQVVVSATRQDHLVRQVAPFQLFPYFTELLGIKNNLAESKTALARAFLEKADIAPESVLFIGDTIHDYETAVACGSACVLVAHGHQHADRLRKTGAPVAESLEQLSAGVIFPRTDAQKE